MLCVLRDSVSGNSLSFAQASNTETMSVKINVLPESPVSSGVTQQIDNIENLRSDLGQSAVDQELTIHMIARGEHSCFFPGKLKLDISGALDFFLDALESELTMQMSALVGMTKSSLAQKPHALRGFLAAPNQARIVFWARIACGSAAPAVESGQHSNCSLHSRVSDSGILSYGTIRIMRNSCHYL